ncbi:hypothetical protein [Paludisphaera mucosa]|uniref:Uncharacterized protein n=1 Tax=Paludisphaera mucosa TaxID=3030827 RepID=A0ABT6FCH1_9BACT|nr:hypothetical protein [Paludisphaera mucosa]MDG3005134.1 hypothetical protein [Paludisphaera mucosa]
MTWPFREPAGLSFDQYRATLRRIVEPRAAQSRLSRLRRRDRPENPRQLLVVADRIGEFLTVRQRRARVRAAWPERELLAAATGTPLEQVDRFLADFDATAEAAYRYRRLGLRGRVRLLADDAPIFAWLSRLFRPEDDGPD